MSPNAKWLYFLALGALIAAMVGPREYHVTHEGNDTRH